MFKRKKAVTLGEAKMRINSEYGKEAQKDQWCKHADQINLKVARLRDTLHTVFELLDTPIYTVQKERTYLSYNQERYNVVNQITGDVYQTFKPYPQGELLAQTLCDALNTEETTRRAKAKAPKEPGLCNCGDKDCALSVTEDHITEPDGVQRNEEKDDPVCNCGIALVCPAYIAGEHK